MAKNGQPEGDRVEIEIGDEGREIAAGMAMLSGMAVLLV
jgi:hypothetical protein